jgi:hypothetical protein
LKEDSQGGPISDAPTIPPYMFFKVRYLCFPDVNGLTPEAILLGENQWNKGPLLFGEPRRIS